MAPLLSLLTLALAFQLPSALAGPACSRKHFQAANCIQLCKSKWGWAGASMGTDPWGSVMHKSDQSTDNAIASACGTTSSTSASATLITSSIATPSSVAASIAVPSSSQMAETSVQVATPSSSVAPTTSTFVVPSSSKSSLVRSTTSAVAPVSSSSSANFVPDSFVSIKSSSQVRATTESPASTPSTRASPPTTTSTRVAPTTSSASRAAQTSAAVVTSSSSATSGSDIDAYLTAHNTARANHGASPLTWSDDLASKAQQWANGCVFEHSGGSLGPFGENLAAGTGDYSIASAVKAWTDEVSEYNASNPVPSHFTQVVWKATTQVGCAVQSCDGIFSSSFGKAKFYVCEYSPAGNVIGEFAENVQA